MTRKHPPTDEPENKDRVIHTRVPESLEAELRERAQALGMSVSNLVRNVLGHAFGLVGDVVADSHAIARAAKGGVPVATNAGASGGSEVSVAAVPVAIADVLAWQAIVLGKNAVCARCNEILPKGAAAAIGLAESGGGRVIICTPCLEELR
ncbi:MAG: hypothetical protein ABJE66_31995 [Deltaproteobacteria bacterium]